VFSATIAQAQVLLTEPPRLATLDGRQTPMCDYRELGRAIWNQQTRQTVESVRRPPDARSRGGKRARSEQLARSPIPRAPERSRTPFPPCSVLAELSMRKHLVSFLVSFLGSADEYKPCDRVAIRDARVSVEVKVF